MSNNANNGRKAETRRIQISLLVSLSLHLVLLSKLGMMPSAMPTTHSGTLQVSLAAPAATLPAPVAPQATTVPEGMSSAQKIEVATSKPVPVNAPVIAVRPAEPTPLSSAPRMPQAEPAKESPPADQPIGMPRAGPTGAAKRVEIEFEIFSGADRQLMGKGRHLYTSQNDESYGVSIKQTLNADEAGQETPWQLAIAGQIDRQGLSPWLFQVKGALSERLMALKDVANSPASLAGKTRNGRNPDGILDRQSLLYQFMLVPPADSGGKLWLTDGKTHGLYVYRIAGFETLALASIGDVRTMKLVLSTSGSAEIIELWLMPDKRYLPAKVRHTDRLGVVTEQVVISIDSK